MRVEETIDIRRPVDEVWRFVSDPVNDPLWCSKVQAIEPTGPGRWKVMHKPVPLRPAKALMVRQEHAEPMRRLKLRQEDDVSVFDVEYRLEAAGEQTHFTQVSDFRWKKLPRLLRGVFGHGVRRDVRRQLRALKRALEEPRAT